MADINLLSQFGNLEQFHRDQMVFFQDEPGDKMYIVLKGEFGIFINSFTDFPIRIAGVREGSFFGEMSVIDDWPRSATVVSESEGGVALAIRKEHFGELLEKDPDISASIMDTLRSRALATADRVRAAGKPVPELPSYLGQDRTGEANARENFLKMLARRVREMNSLLVAVSGIAAPPMALEGQPGVFVRLLPQGYTPFDLDDVNDNGAMLQQMRFACPYCTMDVEGFVPQFTALHQESTLLDGRVIYRNFDILRYTNIVCPHCNYADTYQEFGRRGAVGGQLHSGGSPFRNQEQFTGYAHSHSHSADEAILSYYLHIHCLSLTSNDPLRFAKAWVRLYWIYSDCGSNAPAKQAAANARHYYTLYLQENEEAMSGEDKMRLWGILGELSAVLDDYQMAVDFFQKNIEASRQVENQLLDAYIRRYEEIEGMRK